MAVPPATKSTRSRHSPARRQSVRSRTGDRQMCLLRNCGDRPTHSRSGVTRGWSPAASARAQGRCKCTKRSRSRLTTKAHGLTDLANVGTLDRDQRAPRPGTRTAPDRPRGPGPAAAHQMKVWTARCHRRLGIRTGEPRGDAAPWRRCRPECHAGASRAQGAIGSRTMMFVCVPGMTAMTGVFHMALSFVDERTAADCRRSDP
jgi:hypothetical protein